MISAGHEILGATAGTTGSGECYLISMSKEGVKVSICIPVHLASWNSHCLLMRNPGINGIWWFHQCYSLESQCLYLHLTNICSSLVTPRFICKKGSWRVWGNDLHRSRRSIHLIRQRTSAHFRTRGQLLCKLIPCCKTNIVISWIPSNLTANFFLKASRCHSHPC